MHSHTLPEYLQALAAAKTDEKKAQFALKISELLYDEGDYPQAERYAKDALKVALPTQTGEAHYQIAKALLMQEEIQPAKDAVEQARLTFEKHEQADSIGKCYNLLGALHTNLHQFAEALQNFELAIEHNEKSQNYDQLGRVFGHLAVFVRMAMPKKNIPVFYQNLQEGAGEARRAFIHHNIGHFFRQERQDEEAMAEFQQALSIKQDHNIRHGLADTLYQLASLHDLRGAGEQAFHFYLGALGQSLDEEKPEHVEMILYYFSHALEEVQDASLREHTQSLIEKAHERGFKILPTEGEETNEATPLPAYQSEATTNNLNLADRLAEVAQLEKNLSAEELGKQYAENKNFEIGLIWLRKLLGQYNNAWFNRKSKLKAYDDAKATFLQDLDAALANPEATEEDKAAWKKIKTNFEK